MALLSMCLPILPGKKEKWLLDVHGMDMNGPPPPLPQLFYDSRT